MDASFVSGRNLTESFPVMLVLKGKLEISTVSLKSGAFPALHHYSPPRHTEVSLTCVRRAIADKIDNGNTKSGLEGKKTPAMQLVPQNAFLDRMRQFAFFQSAGLAGG